MVVDAFFWGSIVFVVYAYAGYPVCLLALARIAAVRSTGPT